MPSVRMYPPIEPYPIIEPYPPTDSFNTEEYSSITENNFQRVTENPVSTFSIDVDTASYANIRRFINNNELPPSDAVRIEEMINYFSYDFAEPKDEKPFSVTTEMGVCPWNTENNLVMFGIKGRSIEKDFLPRSNLVFLLDVSGSMNNQNKLPLLKSAFKLLVNNLTENDRVSIVVYAGASGVVLEGATGDQHEIIFHALDSLSAGGSTAGSQGIRLAYSIAKK